jgi:hypothetical protein
LGYAAPTPPTNRAFFAFELDVDFDIVTFAVIVPRISATFHEHEPPVPMRLAIFAFKMLSETTEQPCGEVG